MKDLTIEQKARRYDEAKYIMKEYLESGNAGVIDENTIKKAFPELAESEDERIRKALIRFHKSTIDVDGIKGDDVLAWLEKQGNTNKEYWRGYREGKQEILYKYAELEKQEQNPQITTSTEAKEALYDKPDNHTYSFEDMYEASKQCYDSKYNKDEYCHEQSFKWGFQEGVEWREQKPAAWSEEDEAKLKSILFHIEDVENKNVIDWLKSIKDRVHPKQEWKQENTDDLTDFENAMMHIGGSFFGENAGLDPNDTNAIKEQANILLELVPKQKWSEEDETKRNALISLVEEIKNQPLKRLEDWDGYISWLKSIRPQNNITDKELINARNEAYNDALDKIEYNSDEPTFNDGWSAAIWYLKKRNAMLQSQWKPSEEQMVALDDAIAICSERDYETECMLDNLRQDLKKVRG